MNKYRIDFVSQNGKLKIRIFNGRDCIKTKVTDVFANVENIKR